MFDDRPATTAVRVPRRISRLNAALSFKYEPVRYSVSLDHASLDADEPEFVLSQASGGLAVRNDTVYVEDLVLETGESSLTVDGSIEHYLSEPQLHLRVASDHLSLPEMARLFSSLDGVDVSPAFRIDVSGPLSNLNATANIRTDAGDLVASLVGDLDEPRYGLTGYARIDRLKVSRFVAGAANMSDVTGRLQIDVRTDDPADLDALQGRIGIQLPELRATGYSARDIDALFVVNDGRARITARAIAYDTRVDTNGSVVLPLHGRPVGYDLKGRVAHLNLAALPHSLGVPPADTSITLNYHAVGTEWLNKSTERHSTIDADFLESTIAGATVAAGSTLAATVDGDRLTVYQADASIARLDLQGIGEAFGIASLAEPRFATDLNGDVHLIGRGTRLDEVEATASGTLSGSKALGSDLTDVTFDAQAAANQAKVTVAGAFGGVDPAVVAERPSLTGDLNGTVQMSAVVTNLSGPFSVDNVNGAVTLELTKSAVGGVDIDRASISADYQDRVANVQHLEITGPAANLTGQGTVAFDVEHDSNFAFRADSSDLAQFRQVIDVPLEGIATIDGTITGNRSSLRAAGKMSGTNLSYEDNAVLTLASDFDVRIPDLMAERAHAELDTRATFVRIAGQEINEVAAKTIYEARRVEFDGTASQPQRSVTAAGALTLRPASQEVRLTSLALDTSAGRWQLVAGVPATIDYGSDTLTVRQLELVSGSQRIVADGTIGGESAALDVRVSGVELSGVDALMLREPQFSGQLTATASVTGTLKQPHVEGQFEVVQGAFRQYRYESLAGTVAYDQEGVVMDARLQQNGLQWVAAKGFVPLQGDRPLDVTVDGTALDLGVVQGFTTAVTNVGGVLEAHLRLQGSVQNPAADGTISIRNGTANVTASGARYTGIEADIALQPERIEVTRLVALDSDEKPLTVEGSIGFVNRTIGELALHAVADDFHVLDNELGDLIVDADLTLKGNRAAPVVTGTLELENGKINLDEVLATFGTSPYSETAIQFETTGAPTEPQRTLADAVAADVQVSIPDALVLQGRELQTEGTPIGLGSLNVTVGGDLRVSKAVDGQVMVSGTVNTVRGNYEFQGRRFDILRDGTVRFDNQSEINPRLDLRARRIISGVEANVNVQGTLRQPEIVVSSTPPLEQADILSLIVFNQPINQIGEGDRRTLTSRVQAMAASAVTSSAAQAIGGALNLDVFEVNLNPDAGGTPALTVGQQVGQSLYVKVDQEVGGNAATSVSLEYEILRWLRLQTNVTPTGTARQSLFKQVQSTGVDLIAFFSF
ncbi:MAG TPA: translocation/assembly module TamB domain-containing protein [Vicinamibacterales bacterium]|nr:translocation/assembly module TamB domain-containing protein [Vicinamibacterales bacterium]